MGNFSPNGDLNLAPPSRLERGDCPSVVTGRASWRQAPCEWFRCVFAEWPPAQCGKVPSKDLEIIQEKTAEAGHWKVLQQRKQYSLLVSWSCFLARGIGVSSEALPLWLEKSCYLRTYKINLLGRLRVSWVVRIDCTGEHVGLPAATRMPLSRSVNAGARPVKTMKLIRIRSLECRRFIYIYTHCILPPSKILLTYLGTLDMIQANTLSHVLFLLYREAVLLVLFHGMGTGLGFPLESTQGCWLRLQQAASFRVSAVGSLQT